jgi:lysozyme family protein
MADFAKALNRVLENEGGYVNDPDDPGGETYKGVSRKIWPKLIMWNRVDQLKKEPGFPRNLDADQNLKTSIRLFYRENFWDTILGDKLTNDEIAFALFDFGVNAGVGTTKELARLAIEKQDYNTDAINAMEYEKFMSSFTLAKIVRYLNIVRKRPTSQKYFYGWVRRAMDVNFKND